MQSLAPNHTGSPVYSSEYQYLSIADGRWLSAQLVTWTRLSNQRTLLRISAIFYPPDTSYLTTSCRRYSSHSFIILPLEQSNVRIEVLSVVLTVGPVASKYPLNTQRAQINNCRSETILFSVNTSLGIQDTRAKRLSSSPGTVYIPLLIVLAHETLICKPQSRHQVL